MTQQNIKAAVKEAKEYNKTNQHKQTIELLGHMTDDNMENKYFLDVLGRAYLKTHQTDKAIDLLVEYHEDHPENTYIAITIANAYMAEKEYALAGDALETIMGNTPDNKWAQRILQEVNTLLKEQQANIPERKTYEHEPFSF